MAALANDLSAHDILELLRARSLAAQLVRRPSSVVPAGVPELDAILPDSGFPRGAVVELTAPGALSQATSVALHACASAQQQAQVRGGEPAWCAWLDPSCSLYAPGVVAHGVTLDRLLLVRPPSAALSRVAVRLVASRVFSVVVIDAVGVPGCEMPTPLHRWPNVVRRLAIAAQGGDTSILLLTEQSASRAVGLPVAMRLELAQHNAQQLSVRVAKERRGRIGPPRDVAYVRSSPCTARWSA
ncbi:MAG: recombinase A [Polyangiaceae bacterium]|nr:recombinase A [Polyangiaceae bacterium]